jgi:hypothetical protein
MGRGPGERLEAQMQDLAIMTLASGGRSGGRLLLLGMLVIIVVLAAGWIACAARVRAERRNRP